MKPLRLSLGLLLAGLALAACGTQSAAQALKNWMSQSNVTTNLTTLVGDAHKVNVQLSDPHATAGNLHLVCAVLYLDANAAGAALPTPDSQTSTLLADAYETLLHAVNDCYAATTSPVRRSRARAELITAGGYIIEARARMAAAS